MKNKLLSFLKQTAILLLSASLSGLIVGLYQLGMQQIVKVSTFMYSSRSPIILITLIILVAFCAVINQLIIIGDSSIDGSGIPSMKLERRNNVVSKWYKDIPLLIGNSYASTFSGFTLGSEGPSVVLSSKIDSALNRVFKNKDKTSEEISEGAGFGCAFLSPLAGICYAFEESIETKLNYKTILKTLVIIVIAFLTTSLINKNHLLSLSSFETIAFKDYYIFPLLLLINVIFAVIFYKLMLILRGFFIKRKNNFFIKNRSFALFLITFMLNIFIIDYMQSGGKIIASIHENTNFLILVGVLFLRICITAISGSGSVTGGLVIPIMTIGAINGQIISMICSQFFGFNESYFELISLISALMFFGILIHTPLTSTALLYSCIAFATKDFSIALTVLPIFVLTIFIAYLITSRLFKLDSLYEGMIEISKKAASKVAA